MHRLLSSQHAPFILISLLLLFCATLFSPAGIALVLAFQVSSLPEPWYPVARFLHTSTFLIPFAWLVLSVSIPVLTITFLTVRKYQRYRHFAPVFLVAWIICWGSWPLRTSASQLRKPGLARMTRRAKPLIHAIETYHLKKGQYPQQLNDLVPTVIDKIPYTGAVGYPQFEYLTPTERSLSQSYELRVKTPVGGINWDVFVYWPEKSYPAQMYGGSVERIGDWAYVHE